MYTIDLCTQEIAVSWLTCVQSIRTMHYTATEHCSERECLKKNKKLNHLVSKTKRISRAC